MNAKAPRPAKFAKWQAFLGETWRPWRHGGFHQAQFGDVNLKQKLQ